MPPSGTYFVKARAVYSPTAGDFLDSRPVKVQVGGGTGAATAAAASAGEPAAADDAVPAVTLTAPGAEKPLAGPVTLAANASDDDSGVARIEFQARAAGETDWTTLGVDRAAPYRFRIGRGALANGAYLLRAVAVDRAGNSAVSKPVRVRIGEPAATDRPAAPADAASAVERRAPRRR